MVLPILLLRICFRKGGIYVWYLPGGAMVTASGIHPGISRDKTMCEKFNNIPKIINPSEDWNYLWKIFHNTIDFFFIKSPKNERILGTRIISSPMSHASLWWRPHTNPHCATRQIKLKVATTWRKKRKPFLMNFYF